MYYTSCQEGKCLSCDRIDKSQGDDITSFPRNLEHAVAKGRPSRLASCGASPVAPVEYQLAYLQNTFTKRSPISCLSPAEPVRNHVREPRADSSQEEVTEEAGYQCAAAIAYRSCNGSGSRLVEASERTTRPVRDLRPRQTKILNTLQSTPAIWQRCS